MANNITSPIIAIKGVNIFNVFRVKYFEYIYMLVMVIYMGQMTPETGRMVGTLTGNPIPFLIPIVLTVILVIRNGIQWKRNLFLIISIFFVWTILSLYKYHAFMSTGDLSYHFFLYYAIIIAYIHIHVFGKNYFYIYEHIMVWICKLSLVLWVVNIVLINNELFQFFPETSLGHSILYIYNWISPKSMYLVLENAYVLRNSGCSWEPGRFSIMIVLAMYANIMRNGVSFKNNTNAFWLMLALFSTQSTTGVIATCLLYIMEKVSVKNLLVALFVLAPVCYGISKLDFMHDKIESQINFDQEMLEKRFNYYNDYEAEGEYLSSLGRFESFYFDWLNVKDDPLLGYSRNREHSFFYKNISSNFSLPSGLMKVLAEYGIPLGVFIYILLFLSSKRLSMVSKIRRKGTLFFVMCIGLFSYTIYIVPIFMGFWMFGVFSPAKNR